MRRKMKTLLTVFTLAMLSCQIVSASPATFTNFSYKTIPDAESLTEVVRHTKDNNEQRWYVTLTANGGFSSTEARGLLTSSLTNSSYQLMSPLVPVYTNTRSVSDTYFIKAYNGTRYGLYLTGDQNNRKSYILTIFGDYTS